MHNSLIITLKLILISLFLIDLCSSFWYTTFKTSFLYLTKYFIGDCLLYKTSNYSFEIFEFLESPILSILKLIINKALKALDKRQMTNTKFKFDILENTEEGIVQVGEKEVYNLDGGEVGMNNWYKEKETNLINHPQLKSSFNIEEKGIGKWMKDALGKVILHNNTVQLNGTDCFILSSCNNTNANKSGSLLTKSNFHKAIQGFCARRLISSNVWNEKDEYMKPSDNTLASDDYLQWSNDCIIYSLFDNQSFQSSLRQITYQGKQWDIKNEFFPFSSQGMRTLAENNQFIEMIDDLDEDDTERFVYTEIERIKLEAITFSQEALDLLECFKSLVEQSMPQRKLMHSQHEEYHLNAWDAGYAQCKIFLKEHCAKEFKVFDGLRKALADKLRPKVYEFGFLYK